MSDFYTVKSAIKATGANREQLKLRALSHRDADLKYKNSPAVEEQEKEKAVKTANTKVVKQENSCKNIGQCG